MPAPSARVEEDAAAIGSSGNSKGCVVDVGRLLDLCGLPTSPPPARAAAPKGDHSRAVDCCRDGLADCGPPVELDGSSGEDSADEGFLTSSGGEERGGDRGRRLETPEGGAGVGGGGRKKGRAVTVGAADENALRRVTHQANLYGHLLVRTPPRQLAAMS